MTEAILASEPEIRLGFFIGLFALMALLEAWRPGRARMVSRWRRWPSNLGIVALNSVLLRVVFPAVPLGLAVLAQAQGWGLLNILALPGWLAVVIAVVLFDLAIKLEEPTNLPVDVEHVLAAELASHVKIVFAEYDDKVGMDDRS